MTANAGEAWDLVLSFVTKHGASLEAAAVVEDIIDQHADALAPQIEEQASKYHAFAELVAHTHLGDMSGPGVERVRRLQDALFERGDVGTRWQGGSPIDADRFPEEVE